MIGILYFILTVHSSCIYVCITMGLKWLIIVRTNDAYTMCIMCYNVLLLGAISVAIATPPCVSSLMCVCVEDRVIMEEGTVWECLILSLKSCIRYSCNRSSLFKKFIHANKHGLLFLYRLHFKATK